VKAEEDSLIAAHFILMFMTMDPIDALKMETLYPQLRGKRLQAVFDHLLEMDLVIRNNRTLMYQYKSPDVTTIKVQVDRIG
jgi:hypothetical protein